MLEIQIVFVLIIWVLVFVTTFIPYCFVNRRLNKKKYQPHRGLAPGQSGDHTHTSDDQHAGSGLVLSLCSCFSAGVFLSTCFLSLFPHVRHHFAELSGHEGVMGKPGGSIEGVTPVPSGSEPPKGSHGEGGFPVPELLLILGFVLTLLLEQAAAGCHSAYTAKAKPKGGSVNGRGNTGDVRPPGGTDNLHFSLLDSDEDDEVIVPGVGNARNGIVEQNSGRVGEAGSDQPDPDVSFSHDSEDNVHGEEIGMVPVSKKTIKNGTGQHNHRSNNDSNISTASFHDHHDDENGSHGHAGHAHSHMPILVGPEDRISFSTLALMFGLGIHSVFEGLALGLQTTPGPFFALLTGMISHEILCSATFGIVLARSSPNCFRQASILIATYAATMPLGMIAGLALNAVQGRGMDVVRAVLEGLTAGTFVYVTCVEMIPGEIGHGHEGGGGPQRVRVQLLKGVFVLIGVIVFVVFLEVF